jgi:hypothetical protein
MSRTRYDTYAISRRDFIQKSAVMRLASRS